MRLKTGDSVPLEDGRSAKVVCEIGGGGQGTVYKVKVDGQEYALKWYNKSLPNKDAFKKNLKEIIALGDIAKQFVMPKVVTQEKHGQFGYLMDLLPPSFSSFTDYLCSGNRSASKVRFASRETQVLAGINLVNAFRALHRKGYSYKDLNDGNFFINMQNGEVRIIDNDNISAESQKEGVQGKPGYMAPEVVIGEKPPSMLTDLHSLAVILFKLFIKHDPFWGKRYYQYGIIDTEAEIEHFGRHPVFIFDKKDASNRPKEGVDINPETLWPQFPEFFKEKFLITFGQGLKNPNVRISDDKWQKTLIQLRDEISICPKCKKELLWSAGRCDSDHIFTEKPKRLKIGALYYIPLFSRQKLYACHTNPGSGDYQIVTGKIRAAKDDPAKLVIQNLSDDTWTYRSITGDIKKVEKNGLISLIEGIESITFKNTTAIIGDRPEKALYLKVNQYQLPLFSGQKLRACHTEINGSDKVITGEIRSKKGDPQSLVLKNLSDRIWTVSSKDAERKLGKDDKVLIRDGLSIKFNDFSGKIKYLKIEGV